MMRENFCPKCDSGTIKYQGMEFDISDGFMHYPYECRSCGFVGREGFNVIFDGHYTEHGEKLED